MRRFFAKGLFAVLPIVVTAAVLYLVIAFLYNNVGVPIGEVLKWAFVEWGLIRMIVGPEGKTVPDEHWNWFLTWGAPVIGFCVAILLTLIAGFFVAIFFGDEKKQDFKTAVAVPFPAKGTYSIGFVTSEGMKALNDATKKHLICVFVPAAPTPFSGFVVYVPREDLVPLPLSVDEAMRIIISAGVIHPAHQAVGPTSGLHVAPQVAAPEEMVKGLGRIPDGTKP